MSDERREELIRIARANADLGVDNLNLRLENDRLRAAIEAFLEKHFHGGAKANRPDYVTTVPTEDVYALREALLEDDDG